MPVSWENIVVVTNRALCDRPLARQLERVCAQGPRAVILREKDLDADGYAALAREVLPVCRAAGVELVTHMHADVARELGLRCVHLPLPALQKAAAHGGLEGFAQVGCSVHSVEQALEAAGLGATVLVAGHVFPTDCKPGLEARGLRFLREVCQAVDLPVWAIGGIDLDGQRIADCLAQGAAGTCTMSAAMRL